MEGSPVRSSRLSEKPETGRSWASEVSLKGRKMTDEAVLCVSKKDFGHRSPMGVREMSQLCEENATLKRPSAKVTLDEQIRTEIVR